MLKNPWYDRYYHLCISDGYGDILSGLFGLVSWARDRADSKGLGVCVWLVYRGVIDKVNTVMDDTRVDKVIPIDIPSGDGIEEIKKFAKFFPSELSSVILEVISRNDWGGIGENIENLMLFKSKFSEALYTMNGEAPEKDNRGRYSSLGILDVHRPNHQIFNNYPVPSRHRFSFKESKLSVNRFPISVIQVRDRRGETLPSGDPVWPPSFYEEVIYGLIELGQNIYLVGDVRTISRGCLEKCTVPEGISFKDTYYLATLSTFRMSVSSSCYVLFSYFRTGNILLYSGTSFLEHGYPEFYLNEQWDSLHGYLTTTPEEVLLWCGEYLGRHN